MTLQLRYLLHVHRDDTNARQPHRDHVATHLMSAEYPSRVVMRSGNRSRGAAFSSAARLFRPTSRVTCGTAGAAPAPVPPTGVGAGGAEVGDVVGVVVAVGEGVGEGAPDREGEVVTDARGEVEAVG